MKKKLLFLIPMLLGMVLSACDTGGSNPPSDTGSGSNPPSNDSSGAESEPTSSSSLPITQYTITFKDETGNTLESKKWDEGTTPFYHYEKDDTVEWDYTVDGWSLTINGEVLSILPQVSANATYYAIVSKVKQKYTITFESNGGSDVASITEDYGTLISEPTKPTKKGYKFVGWSTDSAGSKKVTWPFTLTKNETFYANWNEKVGVLNYIQYLLTSIKLLFISL